MVWWVCDGTMAKRETLGIVKCGVSRTCSSNALVPAQQWETAYGRELHSIISQARHSVLVRKTLQI